MYFWKKGRKTVGIPPSTNHSPPPYSLCTHIYLPLTAEVRTHSNRGHFLAESSIWTIYINTCVAILWAPLTQSLDYLLEGDTVFKLRLPTVYLAHEFASGGYWHASCGNSLSKPNTHNFGWLPSWLYFRGFLWTYTQTHARYLAPSKPCICLTI